LYGNEIKVVTIVGGDNPSFGVRIEGLNEVVIIKNNDLGFAIYTLMFLKTQFNKEVS